MPPKKSQKKKKPKKEKPKTNNLPQAGNALTPEEILPTQETFTDELDELNFYLSKAEKHVRSS